MNHESALRQRIDDELNAEIENLLFPKPNCEVVYLSPERRQQISRNLQRGRIWRPCVLRIYYGIWNLGFRIRAWLRKGR